MLPKSCKKSFNSGVVTPTKMRFCNECNDKRMCDRCIDLITENKEIETNLNLFKREASNQFGHMLPFFFE